MQEKENLVRVLKETRNALAAGDVLKLRELSNQTIHSASIYKDTDNISVAVIVYSLSKIISKEQEKNIKGCDEFCKKAGLFIDKAIAALQNNNIDEFKKNLQGIIKSSDKLSPDLKDFVKDVFYKARINKASKVYEHGISMEQTADLLGVSMFELAGYAGQAGIGDDKTGKTVSTKQRIKLAVEMFE